MLLVMHAANILAKPGQNGTTADSFTFGLPQRVTLWDLTWEKIDAFMPRLRNELFSETPPFSSSTPAIMNHHHSSEETREQTSANKMEEVEPSSAVIIQDQKAINSV
jgi:hypothetical protein